MKLLIFGGTGVISSAIVKQGLLAGHEITTVNRGSRLSPYAGQIRTIVADRKAPDFAAKMADVQADVVIDMISFNAADAAQTLELFAGRTGQFIFTSSIAAYARPYRSFPIRESEESLWKDPIFPYAFYKAEMEEYLQEQMQKIDTPITIIRPSLTFGEGAMNFGVLRQNYNVIHRMKQHKPLVMIGDGIAPWSFTFADDLARGFILCCGNPKAYNEDFHITNTEVVMWEDMYHTIGEIIGETPELVYVSSQTLAQADPGLFGHFWYEKKYASLFSNEKIMAAAPEYKPVITLKQGLTDLIGWWEKNASAVNEEKMLLEDTIINCTLDFQKALKEKIGM